MALTGFDAIWLDYFAPEGVNACKPDLELGLRLRALTYPREGPSAIAARTEDPQLSTLLSIRPETEGWKRKDLPYLASRIFGLDASPEWRFDQGGNGELVVQRRWRQDLRGIEAIELVSNNAAVPSHVNLVIQTEAREEIVQFGRVLADSILPSGHAGSRLNVRVALERSFPKEWAEHARGRAVSFVLKEMVVFFPAEVGAAAAGNPLAEVTFLHRNRRLNAEQRTRFVQQLPSQTQLLGPGYRRMVVSLAPVTVGREAELIEAHLGISPRSSNGTCSLRIERTRLVNTYMQRVWDGR